MARIFVSVFLLSMLVSSCKKEGELVLIANTPLQLYALGILDKKSVVKRCMELIEVWGLTGTPALVPAASGMRLRQTAEQGDDSTTDNRRVVLAPDYWTAYGWSSDPTNETPTDTDGTALRNNASKREFYDIWGGEEGTYSAHISIADEAGVAPAEDVAVTNAKTGLHTCVWNRTTGDVNHSFARQAVVEEAAE